MAFNKICEFTDVCCRVKNKYRILGTYKKYLDRIRGDHEAESIEEQSFRRFLWLNGTAFDASSRTFDPTKMNDWSYKSDGFRTFVIVFKSIVDIASPDIAADFWSKLAELFIIFFPSGVDATAVNLAVAKATSCPVDDLIARLKKKLADAGMAEGQNLQFALSLVAVVERNRRNPIIEDLAKQTDVVIQLGEELIAKTTDVVLAGGGGEAAMKQCTDFSQLPQFHKIVNIFVSNMSTGRYTAHNLSSLFRSVLDAVPQEAIRDDKAKGLMKVLTSVCSDLERNRPPDTGRLLEALQYIM